MQAPMFGFHLTAILHDQQLFMEKLLKLLIQYPNKKVAI